MNHIVCSDTNYWNQSSLYIDYNKVNSNFLIDPTPPEVTTIFVAISGWPFGIQKLRIDNPTSPPYVPDPDTALIFTTGIVYNNNSFRNSEFLLLGKKPVALIGSFASGTFNDALTSIGFQSGIAFLQKIFKSE